MSITVSSRPSDKAITNRPKYTMTTSIVEGSSYQNVRIRGTLYVDGEVAGIIENPQGVNDFDFTKMLDAIAGKFKADFVSSSKTLSPVTSGTNLISSWTDVNGNMSETNSTNRLQGSPNGGGTMWFRSTDMGALNAGDIIVLVIGTSSNIGDYGSDLPFPELRLSESSSVDTDVIDTNICGYTINNTFKGLFYFMATEDMTASYLWLGNINVTTYSSYGIDMYYYAWKVPSGRDAQYNMPCVYHKVVFQTYYEDSSNVTQSPSTELEDSMSTMLYAPVKTQNALSDYVVYPTSSSVKFPCKSIGLDNVSKHFYYHKSYTFLRILVLNRFGYGTRLYYSIDNATYSYDIIYHGGWFMINVQSASFLSAATTSLRLYVYEDGYTSSVVHEIELSAKCFDEPVVLDFQGLLGNENIVLNGVKNRKLSAGKEMYKNKYGMNLPVSRTRVKKITVETNNQPEEYNELLGELLCSIKDILMYSADSNLYEEEDGGVANCLPVAINTEIIEEDSDMDLINNKIELTYYPYDEEY